MGKIKLKYLEASHAEELFSLVQQNREYLRQWLPWVDSTKTSKDSLQFIELCQKQKKENQGEQFGVFLHNKLIGMVGQHQISWAHKRTSLGYWLSQNETGQGFMTQAIQKVLQLTFEKQNLNCVEIRAAVENLKSRAVPEKFGFKLDGVLRHQEWLYDHFVDHASYSLLKKEWEGRQL